MRIYDVEGPLNQWYKQYGSQLSLQTVHTRMARGYASELDHAAEMIRRGIKRRKRGMPIQDDTKFVIQVTNNRQRIWVDIRIAVWYLTGIRVEPHVRAMELLTALGVDPICYYPECLPVAGISGLTQSVLEAEKVERVRERETLRRLAAVETASTGRLVAYHDWSVIESQLQRLFDIETNVAPSIAS